MHSLSVACYGGAPRAGGVGCAIGSADADECMDTAEMISAASDLHLLRGSVADAAAAQPPSAPASAPTHSRWFSSMLQSRSPAAAAAAAPATLPQRQIKLPEPPQVQSPTSTLQTVDFGSQQAAHGNRTAYSAPARPAAPPQDERLLRATVSAPAEVAAAAVLAAQAHRATVRRASVGVRQSWRQQLASETRAENAERRRAAHQLEEELTSECVLHVFKSWSTIAGPGLPERTIDLSNDVYSLSPFCLSCCDGIVSLLRAHRPHIPIALQD